jgi:hypothetical protein
MILIVAVVLSAISIGLRLITYKMTLQATTHGSHEYRSGDDFGFRFRPQRSSAWRSVTWLSSIPPAVSHALGSFFPLLPLSSPPWFTDATSGNDGGHDG